MDSSKLEAAGKKYAPVLAEARRRVVVTAVVFAVATLVGFIFYEPIIKLLLGVLALQGVNVVFTSPFQFINLAISCGAAMGLLVAVPLLIMQTLFFLKPGLRKPEYRLVARLVPLALGLFFLGFGFGVVIMRWQIEIFLSRSVALGIGNILDISRLLSTVMVTAGLMGLGFQFPIILLGLMRLGVVERKQVAGKRLWVYLAAFIFTMFLPADSVLVDLILTLPLVGLFELTLMLERVMGRAGRVRAD